MCRLKIFYHSCAHSGFNILQISHFRAPTGFTIPTSTILIHFSAPPALPFYLVYFFPAHTGFPMLTLLSFYPSCRFYHFTIFYYCAAQTDLLFYQFVPFSRHR